jgi:hypothetical protein
MADQNYPEHRKLCSVQKESQFIGEFLEWLLEKHVICDEVEDGFLPVRKSINGILSDFFHIDLNKLEKEKIDMIDLLREDRSINKHVLKKKTRR